MRRHRILVPFSLILSVLHLVHAAPIVVMKRHEVGHDVLAVAEDVAAMLKKRYGLEASSDRSTSSRSPPDEVADSQHSDVSTSALGPDLGNPGSSHPSTSGQSEIQLPAWSQELDAELASQELPRPSSGLSETSEVPLHPYPLTSSSESETEMPLPERSQEFSPGSPAPSLPAELASPRSSTSGSSEIPYMAIPEWLRKFVPPRPPAPQTSDGLPPSSSSQPPDVHPDNGNFFDKEVMKKIGIPAAVAMVGGTMIAAGILGLEQHYKDN